MSRSSGELTLVDDSQPASTITWWAPDDEPVAAFAAEELQSYIERSSETTLPLEEVQLGGSLANAASVVVVTSDDISAPPLSVVEAADRATEDQRGDAFALEVTETALVCAGTTHRGTLYGVYAFLEKLGVRFFAPRFDFYEGYAEHIPSMDTVTTPAGEFVESPDMRYRRKYVAGPSNTPQAAEKVVDWMAKTRHNVVAFHADVETLDEYEEMLKAVRERGLLLEAGGHSFDIFLPPEEYRVEHPEWFVDGYNIFDMTQKDAVDEYVKNALDFLDVHSEIDIFAAWPPDSAKWPPDVVDSFGHIGNAYASVVNRLANAVEERFPDRHLRIETIAYSSHVQPPDPEHMYDESMIVDFAPMDRSYARSINVHPSDVIDGTGRMEPKNPFYWDRLEAWRNRFDGTLGIYEYYRKYAWHSLPGVPKLVSTEIPVYADAGAQTIGTYAEPADWITYELTHIVLSKLAWDNDRDPNALIEEYLHERFDQASDAMLEYYEHTETGSRPLFDGFDLNFNRKEAITKARSEYEAANEALNRATTILNDTRSSEGASMVVDRLAANIEFAIADVEITYYEGHNEPKKAEQARVRARELIDEHAYDGVVLRSRWCLRRTDLSEDAIPTDTEAAETYRRAWDD